MTSPPIDGPRIRELALGIPGGVPELVELFVSHTSRTLTELRAAIEVGDSVAVRALAHRGCGSAGAFGATRLLELLRALEAAAKQDRPDAFDGIVHDIAQELARTHDALSKLLDEDPATS